MDDNLDEELARARNELVRLVDILVDRQSETLETLSVWCADCLAAGGKLLLFGNGGSAAQAQHLAAEFVNRYAEPRRALAALALGADGAVLSSIGNDDHFAHLFSRQLEALGRPGDVAIAISTSGVSPNIVEGLKAARRHGMRAAALLGRDGGPAREQADLALIVEGRETARIQEVQLLAGHLLCQRVERLLRGRDGAIDT